MKRPIDITDPRFQRGRRRWPWIAGIVIGAIVLGAVMLSTPPERPERAMRITRKQDWRTDSVPRIDLEEWLFFVSVQPDFESKTARDSFQIPGQGTVYVDIDGFVNWTAYSKGRSVSFHHNGADIEVFDVDAEILRRMCRAARSLSAYVADDLGRTVSCPEG